LPEDFRIGLGSKTSQTGQLAEHWLSCLLLTLHYVFQPLLRDIIISIKKTLIKSK